MAKNSIPEFDVNDSGNTDMGGIGLTDNDSAGNLVQSIKKLMSILKKTNNGTTPLDDVFRVRNVDDTTKQASISAANVPSGTSRALDAEALYRNGAVTETRYEASGTHTFADTTRYFQIEAVGGGGGGGGVDGQGANRLAAASGGSSGFYGKTAILAIGSVEEGTIVVGAGGTSGNGAGGGNGGNGGGTTWSDGTHSFTWGGGRGGRGIVADTGTAGLADLPAAAPFTGALIGHSNFNTLGSIRSGTSLGPIPGIVQGGPGASSPFGSGGAGGLNASGATATGYGAGGGGASVTEVATNWVGGGGSGGILIVREW